MDPILPSASLRSHKVRQWLQKVELFEQFINAILAIVHQDLLQAGLEANVTLNNSSSDKPYNWTSAFSGMDLIVNRITPPHQDAGGTLSFYDLLVSLGEGHQADFHVTDLGACFTYHPGTLIFLTGKVLEHAVPAWGGGERAVIAHYMKDLLHDRMDVQCPSLPSQMGWWTKFGSGK